MRVFASHVSTALVALFAFGAGAIASVHAADPPTSSAPRVVFDDMDNPVSPARLRRPPPVPDSIAFDAYDNPITPKAAIKPTPAAGKPAAAAARHTPAAQSGAPVATAAPTPAPSAAPIALTPAVFNAPTPCDATVRASPNPLKAWATALTRDGDRLYLGLHDGGIAWCDPDGGRGMVVRLTLPTLPVRALAAQGGAVWWVSSDGATVFSYRAANRAVTAYPVTASASASGTNVVASARGWVQRIALLDGAVLLSGDRATRVLDPATGSLRLPTVSDGLPADALQAGGAESLYIVGGDIATVAAVGGYSQAAPRVWRSTAARRGEREWREVNVASASDEASLVGLTRRNAAALRFDLEDAGFVLAQPGGLRLLLSSPTRSDNADARIVDVPFRRQPGMPTALDRFCVGASGAWWLMHGTLFHAAPDDGQSARQEAYLPWNSAKGSQVQTLLPDADGVYVALDRGGVRHITPDKPSAEDGYGGYIRARLGDETTQPTSDTETTIAAGIEEWQGVPYLWGGQSMTGTDCSGFVGAMHKSVGITIPRSTAEMKASHEGTRIRDEIRYGDVLVYPGHCALYTGDGHTAETVSAGVGKASIWRRTDVVVKRYLP